MSFVSHADCEHNLLDASPSSKLCSTFSSIAKHYKTKSTVPFLLLFPVYKYPVDCRATVTSIIKLKLFPVPVRLHSGSGKLKFRRNLPYFAIFKKVVHSLEPGETPSNSASHQAPNYAQRS